MYATPLPLLFFFAFVASITHPEMEEAPIVSHGSRTLELPHALCYRTIETAFGVSLLFKVIILCITPPVNTTRFQLISILPPTTFDLLSGTPSPSPTPTMHPIPTVSHLYNGRPYRTVMRSRA